MIDRLLILSLGRPPLRSARTGELVEADFEAGPVQVLLREAALEDAMLPARELYAAPDHVALRNAVDSYRSACEGEGLPEAQWGIVSAGYGLVDAARPLAPYRVRLTGRNSDGLRRWGQERSIPREVRRALREPYALGLVALEREMAALCDLDWMVRLGGPTYVFHREDLKDSLPAPSGWRGIALAGHRGPDVSPTEFLAQVVARLADRPSACAELVRPGADLLEILFGV